MERGIQIFSIASILLIPLMLFGIRRLVLRPLNALDKGMRELEGENLEYRLSEESSTVEFRRLNHVFNAMAARIKHAKIEGYEHHIEQLKTETVNLRLQINPHLLLNSLNMIYSLAQSRNHEVICTYALNLMGYFRYSLKNDTLVRIREEMGFIHHYLEIQKIRFPEAFVSVYDIGPVFDPPDDRQRGECRSRPGRNEPGLKGRRH
jgi:sensor histidine kinase YesM